MTLLEIDPNLVKPGWTPLLIIIGIACVMVLLFVSMRRQFKKIQVPSDTSRLATETGSAQGHRAAHQVSPASPAAGRDDSGVDIRDRSKPDAD